MASFFRGFGRQSTKGNNQQNKGNGQQSPSPTSFQSGSPSSSLPPTVPQIPPSPSLAAGMALEAHAADLPQASRNKPFFFREEYSTLIVKGNFMTLATQPQLVDQGEWLAHQVVEQWRLLNAMMQVVLLRDETTGKSLCNSSTCPTMSAAGQIYTWLDTDKRPKKVPADTYMQMIQKWVDTKVMDTHLFPTDTNFKWLAYSSTGTSTPGSENQNPIPAGPTSLNSSLSTLSGSQWMGKESGFPKEFETEVRSIYRQINRCYAHLYWGHWLNPFWHTNLFRELNTCYIHFVNVGKVFGLLSDRDLEPMQGLIDVWTEKGLLPQTTKPQTTQQQPSGSQEQANSESQASAPAPAAVANPTSGAM